MNEFLILKTMDGTVHKGWIVWIEQNDDLTTYHLLSPEGARKLGVLRQHIVYVELLEKGHARITMPYPEAE